jgi:SAM-dependent methyltransferase
MPTSVSLIEPPPAPEAGVIVAEAFDAIADHYDTAYQDARCRAEDGLLKRYLDTFLGALPDIGTVLDLGCGTGLFLRLTDWPQNTYTGVDISPEMLRHARQRFPLGHFIEASMEDHLPLTGGFSAVVSLYALSYVATPQHAINEIWRLLRPGGRCFLVVYAPRWYRAYSHRVPAVDLPTSPAAWSVWQAMIRMRVAGFTRVHLKAFSVLPTPLILIEEALARRFPALGRYLIMEGVRQ